MTMKELPEPEEHLELPASTGEAFESPTAQPQISEDHETLALRMLYEEQVRLRAEMGKLKEKGEGGDKGGDDKEEGDDEKDEKEDKPPLKQRIRTWVKQHPIATVLIVVAFLLLVIGAIWLIHYLNSYTDTDDAFIDGHTDPISARINGYVANVYVEDTWRVHKGQLLLVLDPRDNQVAKEQASANYAQAKAGTRAQEPNIPITATDLSTQVANTDYQIVNAQAQVAAAEERYNAALADLKQAEAQHANAVREEERYRQLVVKEEVSREQYDQRATEEQSQAAVVASRKQQAEATRKLVTQAEAQLGQARQQHEQARKNLPEQVATQKAELAQRKAAELAAKAQADQAELNYEYTRIYAPEDGVIGDKQVQVATQVAPGQELFALTQTNDIWITANFKETQIKRMHNGQSVTVYVDALGKTFEGYIKSMPGASGAVYSLLPPENATGNYVKVVQRMPVRIRLNPGQAGLERLSPGMSVEPKVWLR
jgi:membrane fusion protein (multidrug efflux system)